MLLLLKVTMGIYRKIYRYIDEAKSYHNKLFYCYFYYLGWFEIVVCDNTLYTKSFSLINSSTYKISLMLRFVSVFERKAT